MKNLFSHFRSLFFIFLCSVSAVQSMELENLSKKVVYGATSQSKPLQKMPFHPVGPGLDQTLNRLIKLEHRCVEGFYIRLEQQLPADAWEIIWGYLNSRDKLRLGSLAHSFEYIRQHVQLDVCRETLLRERFYNTLRKSYLDVFCEIIATIGDIHNNTKIDTLKICCRSLLEENKDRAQVIIEASESWIKSQRHYTKTENYQKLKYLKEVFNEPDTCNVWCTECQDEWRDTGKDCLDVRHNAFCIKCKNELDSMTRCDRCMCFWGTFMIVVSAVTVVFGVVSIILLETGVIGHQKNGTFF